MPQFKAPDYSPKHIKSIKVFRISNAKMNSTDWIEQYVGL